MALFPTIQKILAIQNDIFRKIINFYNFYFFIILKEKNNSTHFECFSSHNRPHVRTKAMFLHFGKKISQSGKSNHDLG